MVSKWFTSIWVPKETDCHVKRFSWDHKFSSSKWCILVGIRFTGRTDAKYRKIFVSGLVLLFFTLHSVTDTSTPPLSHIPLPKLLDSGWNQRGCLSTEFYTRVCLFVCEMCRVWVRLNDEPTMPHITRGTNRRAFIVEQFEHLAFAANGICHQIVS